MTDRTEVLEHTSGPLAPLRRVMLDEPIAV